MIFYIQHYGFWGCLNLLYEYIMTKIFYSNAKLIRRPFEIRGKKYISIGSGFTSGRYCRIESHSDKYNALYIGKNCQINDSVHIVAKEKVVIKNNVLIASRVFISDLNHGNYNLSIQSKADEIVSDRTLFSKPVIIGNNVWLGEGVAVLPGVTIGDNTIVGANSVVTKDLDANSIYAGNPATIIKRYDDASQSWVRY